MFKLTITHEGKMSRVSELDLAEVTIGSGESNDLVISGDGVSERQARIVHNFAKNVSTLYDLRSANGTKVNGKTIKAPYVLSLADVITISGVTIEVEWSESAEPEEVSAASESPVAQTRREEKNADPPSDDGSIFDEWEPVQEPWAGAPTSDDDFDEFDEAGDKPIVPQSNQPMLTSTTGLRIQSFRFRPPTRCRCASGD